MTLFLDQIKTTEHEIKNFEVISQTGSDITCQGGMVMIPKESYEHLSVDEHEHILMKFIEVQENTAEIPQTLLLQAKKTMTDVKILGQFENHIFDDGDTIYFDLLKDAATPR